MIVAGDFHYLIYLKSCFDFCFATGDLGAKQQEKVAPTSKPPCWSANFVARRFQRADNNGGQMVRALEPYSPLNGSRD